MKNFIFFSLILLVFSACQNMEQYKTGVEGLSTKWEATNNKVNDFAAQINSELINHNNMLGNMEVDQTIFASLPAEAQTKITDAKQSCTELDGDFGELQSEIKTFLSEWELKGAELAALQEGMATGELTGDIAEQITALNDFVADAEMKLATWNSNLETVKTACAASHSKYASVLAQVMPVDKK